MENNHAYYVQSGLDRARAKQEAGGSYLGERGWWLGLERGQWRWRDGDDAEVLEVRMVKIC